MIELVEFWKRCDFCQFPYVHDADRPHIEALRNEDKVTELQSHCEFVRDRTFGNEGDSSLHVGLLPLPYQGDLSKADIFIIMLNPGLGLSDYQTQEDERHCEQVRLILRQDFAKVEYPFLSLNPEYAWTGGFQWWEKKLREVMKKIANDYRKDYAEVLHLLSQRLAAIEIFPYHSRHFSTHSLMSKLPSVQKAKEFVHSLVPRARKREIIVIVVRSIRHIGIEKEDYTLVNYDPKHAQGASLGLNTPGGKAIIKALEQRPPQ